MNKTHTANKVFYDVCMHTFTGSLQYEQKIFIILLVLLKSDQMR